MATVLAGCAGASGTISISLVTAPGSTVMEDVQTAQLVLVRPFTVVEAERGPEGDFALSLDVVADGPSSDILFNGLDASGEVIAYGRTPPVPIAAIDAQISIYVAPPMSIAEAPVSLEIARSEISAGGLDYGVLLAGGRDAAGAPTTDIEIYNTYDHTLQPGLDMPGPRAGVTVATGVVGYAYLFGGEDADAEARGTLWRFDTTVSPAGEWLEGDESADLARTDAAAAPLGSDAFLVLGTPPILLEGLFLRATGFDTPDSLAGEVTSIATAGGEIFTLVLGQGAGTTGIVRLSGTTFSDEADVPASATRTGHVLVPTFEGTIVALGGTDGVAPLTSAIVCDPVARTYVEMADILATGRTEAGAAASSTVIVVAGGRDAAGEVLGDAEVLDATTLAPVAVLPLLVPRAGATVRILPNQQILVVGGVDAAGAPTDTIELFTPRSPDLTQ
jgi:hypothetical protein